MKVDAGSKLIDHDVVTTLSVADGDMAWQLLDERDQGQDLHADNGYDWEKVKDGIVLVDRMGLLARLYRYGDIAYVGGGFGDGIHSLLEPAAWGCPVICGPLHTKFPEAQGLIDVGSGFEVRNAEELLAVIDRLLGDAAALAKASDAARYYVQGAAGATDRIVSAISGRLRA